MGWPDSNRWRNSRRSSICATLYRAASLISPRCPSGISQRLLNSTTVFVAVEQLEDLRLVGLRVPLDFVRGQRRPGLRPARRIANHRREVADDEDDAVAEVLEVLHLADQHRVAEVEIGRGGVEADLDDQRAASASRARRSSSRTTSTQPRARWAVCFVERHGSTERPRARGRNR